MAKVKVLNRNEVLDAVMKKLTTDLQSLFKIADREDRRKQLVDILLMAADDLQTLGELHVAYLGTIAHGIKENAKPGETCADLLARMQQAMSEWRIA
jgi:hypothetical protein